MHRSALLLAAALLLVSSNTFAQQIEPPKLKSDASADYPAAALAEKFFQPVTVNVIIVVDASGNVTTATVVDPQGHGFDEAAVAAAKQLTFDPATKNGAPIAAKLKWRFSFAPPAPKLAGNVRLRVSEKPIAGATVTAREANGESFTQTTDEQGHWHFDALAPGGVHITVAANGLVTSELDETIAAGEETDIVVRLDRVADAPVVPPPGVALPGPVEEVTVKGEKPPREVTKRTLTKDEIEHIPGTNGDALRSLQNLPGVARPPPFSGLLVVRGSAPEDTRYFVDGTDIPIIYHFFGLSSVVPSEVLDKIDFYPGNYSAQFGRGMGGVVDVGIRDPSPDGKYHGMAQADLIDLRALAEGPILDTGWKLLLGGRRSWFDVWLTPILKRQGGTSVTPKYYDYQAELQKKINDHSSFRLLFFGSDDALRIVQPASATTNPTLSEGLSDSTKFWRLQARYQNKLSDKTELRVTGAVGKDIVEAGFGTNYVHTETTPLSLRAEVAQKIAHGVTANGGIDIIYEPYNIGVQLPERNRPGVPANGPGQNQTLNSHQTGDLFLPGVYTEWEIAPWKGARVVPGLRADYDSATAKWDVAPRINLRQDLTSTFPKTTLKGGVGLYYQPPQPMETDPVFGQVGLVSNRSVSYDAGFEQDFTRYLNLSTDFYYKDLDRLVTQGAGNSGSGFAYGVEWLLKYRTDGKFFGWIAYTLSRSERRDTPTDPLRITPYDQTHNFTLVASYKLPRKWQVGARFRVVTGNVYTPNGYGAYDATAGRATTVAAGTNNEDTRLPIFEQLDVRVDKSWQFEAWKLTFYVDIQNIYNRQNAEGITYNYNSTQSSFVTGLPFLPSIGLRAEF